MAGIDRNASLESVRREACVHEGEAQQRFNGNLHSAVWITEHGEDGSGVVFCDLDCGKLLAAGVAVIVDVLPRGIEFNHQRKGNDTVSPPNNLNYEIAAPGLWRFSPRPAADCEGRAQTGVAWSQVFTPAAQNQCAAYERVAVTPADAHQLRFERGVRHFGWGFMQVERAEVLRGSVLEAREQRTSFFDQRNPRERVGLGPPGQCHEPRIGRIRLTVFGLEG